MKFTTRDQVKAWLNSLVEEQYDVVAPRDVDGKALYRQIGSADEVLFDYERPDLSAKDCFFPATEVLLRAKQQGSEVTQEEMLPNRKQIIFGMRPCDAHGTVVIDALFLQKDPADAYYRHHRERTVLVGLACPQMWDGCFCTSVGGAPDDATHLDVLLREVESGYAVEAVTEKGTALVESLSTEERDGEAPKPATETEQVPVVEPGKWRPLFEDKIWMRHGERCLSCRICTYVCPTCRCFDVVDRVTGVRGDTTHIERIRVWDACPSPNYRRAAGGHNSRPTKPVRLRNRFYCKFCYYPEDFGPLGCVGCGRCVVSCPVDIDIREVMQDVAKAE
jgi:ferredoxin